MSIQHKIIVFSIVLLIITGTIIAVGLQVDEEPIEDVEEPSISHSAWIPDWGTDDGIDSLQKTKDLFQNISPVWYEIENEVRDGVTFSNGDLKITKPTRADEIIKIAHDNNIEVYPTIAMFDYTIIKSVFSDQGSLNNHVEKIYSEVIENDYDGIDLDYESTRLEDKEKYFEFLELLSEKLHNDDKKMIVTVLPQWGAEKYTSLSETRAVQDWKRIAEYADRIRIMTYDYTFSKSMNPGPIAPSSWVKEVLDYAISQNDASKYVLGVHLYSYEWSDKKNEGTDGENQNLSFIGQITENGVRKKRATSYIFETIEKILDHNKGEITEYQGEKIFRYTTVDKKTRVVEDRVLVYIDQDGIQERVELAEQYGLSGVVYWRLGGEGNLLQKVLPE